MEYNPFARETQTNPYPVYRWMRDEAPVYHNAEIGFYALSRFDDVMRAHLDPATFLSGYGPMIEAPDRGQKVLVGCDDPDHAWQRKLVSRVFTPRAITDLEPTVRAIAAEVLEDARDRGSIDVVPELSAYLPMMVIAEMLGIPHELRGELHEFSDRVLDRSGSGESGGGSKDAALAMGQAVSVLRAVVDEKERNPGDDVTTLLINGRATDADGNERGLSRELVLMHLLELVVAGHETTAKLIANGVVALAWYPDPHAELAADPSLVPQAIEEMLRWDTPSHYQGRWVERPVTVHGVTIPADSRVVLVTGAANHDDRVFADPDAFDIHRKFERHVSFGFGIHLCVGAALARLETRVAFEELLLRYPTYELDQPMKRAFSSNVRGLSSLPITF